MRISGHFSVTLLAGLSAAGQELVSLPFLEGKQAQAQPPSVPNAKRWFGNARPGTSSSIVGLAARHSFHITLHTASSKKPTVVGRAGFPTRGWSEHCHHGQAMPGESLMSPEHRLSLARTSPSWCWYGLIPWALQITCTHIHSCQTPNHSCPKPKNKLCWECQTSLRKIQRNWDLYFFCSQCYT